MHMVTKDFCLSEAVAALAGMNVIVTCTRQSCELKLLSKIVITQPHAASAPCCLSPMLPQPHAASAPCCLSPMLPQPHAAYARFIHGLSSRWSYVSRTLLTTNHLRT